MGYLPVGDRALHGIVRKVRYRVRYPSFTLFYYHSPIFARWISLSKSLKHHRQRLYQLSSTRLENHSYTHNTIMEHVHRQMHLLHHMARFRNRSHNNYSNYGPSHSAAGEKTYACYITS